MIFLAPMAGLIAASLALPAVVALYVLKLRRRPVRVSSTILWERAAKDLEVNVPFRWLRASWPLALQLLAAASLAAAIARPTLGGAGAGGGGRVMILIDRSASMNADDGVSISGETLTRLDRARRGALEQVAALRRSGVAPEVTVAAFAAGAAALGTPSANFALARELIESITPTDQPGNLDAAADLIRAFAAPIEGREERGPAPLVHVFTDGCNPPPTREVVIPGVDVVVHRAATRPADAASGSDNLGIVGLSARRDYDDPATLRVLVRVLADVTTGEATAGVPVRLLIDGEPVASGSLTLRASAAFNGAAEASGSFAIPLPRGGVLTAVIPSGDPLRADDTASLVVSPPSLPRVLVVGPGPSEDRDAGVDPLIRSCLRVMDLGRVEFVAAADAASRLGAGAVLGADLLILDRVRPATLPAVPTISFGAGVPIPAVRFERAPHVAGEGAGAPTRVVAWRRTHPLLRSVPLDGVVAERSAVLGDDREAAGAERVGFESLAEGFDGSVMALIDDAGVRRVVIGFALGDSNWGPTASFPVFLAGAVDFLTLRAESSTGRATTTGEPLVLRAAAGVGQIVARPVGAPGEALTSPVGGPGSVGSGGAGGQRAGEAGRPVSLGVPVRAAVYLVDGVIPQDAVAAVNLVSPEETLLSRGLDSPSGRAPSFPIAGSVGADRVSIEGSIRGEIWHWFLALGALLMALEWFVVAWRMRVGPVVPAAR